MICGEEEEDGPLILCINVFFQGLEKGGMGLWLDI